MIGAYDVPWLFMTGCMVYAMTSIKKVVSKIESSDNYVMNENRMRAFLVSYVLTALVFLVNTYT